MSENIRELRGYNDTHNTKSSQQDNAYASPGRNIAGPSGQVSSQEGQNNHPV